MNPRTKSALLGVAITFCLMVAVDKIYNFYTSHQPPAQVGECLLVIDKLSGPIKLHIISNDNLNGMTTAVMDVDLAPGIQLRIPAEVSYAELREHNAIKVNCK